MGLLSLIGEAIWFILPAYFANASPVVIGGGRPIDGGRKFFDGRPIFGPGKTVRGFLGGLSVGTAVGGLQALMAWDFWLLPLAFLLSLGALCGDLFGSFVKRRLGFERGRPLPLLDQLGFLLFALLFASPLLVPPFSIFMILLVLTGVFHLLTNYLAYRLGLKKEPY